MTAIINLDNKKQVEDFTKSAVQAALCEALFSPLMLEEKHSVKVKQDFDTACWSFQPPHAIYVGTGIVARGKPGLTTHQLARYVKSHVRHEFGHALFTERNSKVINGELTKIQAPFKLWNLFEDARIEEAFRVKDCPFNWLEFENLRYSVVPENMLFALIQAENSVKVVESFYENINIGNARQEEQHALKVAIEACQDPNKKAQMEAGVLQLQMGPPCPEELEREKALSTLGIVTTYYDRIIAAKNSAETFPILADWLAEFGQTKSAPSRGDEQGDEVSDLMLGYLLANNAALAAEFDKDTSSIIVPVAGKPPVGPVTAKPDTPIAAKGNVLQDTPSYMDIARIEALTQKFKKFFETESRTVRTNSPQHRISARHYAVGRPFYKSKQLVGKSRKALLMFVDCSASMEGFHIEEGKIVVAALSRLAKAGYLSGHVVLSMGLPSRWETFALPMSDETISRISGSAGAEGLEQSITGNMKLAQQADHVLVYTDAQIGDGPIDKLKLHQHGVYTWGLYAGEALDYIDKLTAYFDKAIMRENAEQLVDAMLLQKK